MSKENIQLRVDGLSSLQLAELQAALASADSGSLCVVENPNLTAGKVGEPTLLGVVITLGPSVISAFALWLAKQKITRTKNIKYTKVDANGGMESFEMNDSSYGEGASPPAAIETFLKTKFGYDDRATR